ncbi:OadG family protein [Selenomonas bovis]|jgi:glutaconyl-CoA/methylmalonyl-CoA decarboxylase subunit delta|uniref:OadG family protein n=1 Tax=Selenomonas bovis TaxID=416586 RepID=A0A848B145_9FIRM|nr:OadG family protein [Selenomonas bovis]MCI7056131.1 OadG family protein [Selenomonas bovis]NMD97929.1 OadG family protein [Selenomonas bovis]
MSEPVTTNPFVIMLINMTVVFIVLIALGLVINLIHAIDPTKEKAAPQKEAPAPAPTPAAPAPEPVSADGVSPEVIAVIAAALASYGYGPAAIRAVRPIERDGWKNAGRSFGVQRTLE